MPAKSRLTRLDAFAKTVEDARVRTSSGGVVTIASLLIVLYLVLGEWTDYRRIDIHPELIVDKSRGEKMEIHLNISFPRIPCEILTLDVMDLSGDQQTGIMSGVNKVRLAPVAEGSHPIEVKPLDLHAVDEVAIHLSPDYCGSCYNAPAPPNAKKAGCCQTCEEVREAYGSISWAFGLGDGVEQCVREGYGVALSEHRAEGCRIEGDIRVNKVAGNFHIAPGRSFSNMNVHVHDLETFFNSPIEGGHTFTHKIHHLRFGPKLPDLVRERMRSKAFPEVGMETGVNPLDGTEQATDETSYNYMYFVKVVSTAYLPLGHQQQKPVSQELQGKSANELVRLGTYGTGIDGSIETHQYSVTSHKRSLFGGDDGKDGHKEVLHARGGIPGVFFSYEISPMKIINREQRTKTFAALLTGICAAIGGTLTVAAAIDRGVYEGSRRVNKMHQT